MKTARDIVIAAYTYLNQVAPPSQKIAEVRVEEVVPMMGEDKGCWKVVLSYDNVGEFSFDRKREFKEFKVKDDDASVVSMQSVVR